MASNTSGGPAIPTHLYFFTPGVPKRLDRLAACGLFPERMSYAAQSHTLLKAVNPAPPQFDGAQMTLAEPGFYVGEANGEDTLFIAIPPKDYDRALLAFRLISNLTTGRQLLNDELYHDGGSLIMDLIACLKPIEVSCGGAAHLVNFLFVHLGLYSRSIHWTSLDKTAAQNRYHIGNEVYLKDCNSWLYMDAHWGLFFDAGYSALAFRDDPWERQKTFLRDRTIKTFITPNWPEQFDPTQRRLLLRNQRGRLMGIERTPDTDTVFLQAQQYLHEPIDLLPPDAFIRCAFYEGTNYHRDTPRAEGRYLIENDPDQKPAPPPSIVLYAFGSCRTYTPLAVLANMKLFQARHADTGWYIHSTRDTLQKIEILTGNKVIPPAFIPLITSTPERYNETAIHPNLLDDVTCFVVEISSLKTFTLDGIEVQQWCVRDLAKNAGVDMEAYNTALLLPPKDRDLSFLAPDVPALVRAIAERGEGRLLTNEEIAEDLGKIVARLGPEKRFVFIPAINVQIEDGKPIPDRERLYETMRSFCKDHGHGFFDTSPIINAYGPAKALVDVGHYQEAFIPHLSSHLMNLVCPVF